MKKGYWVVAYRSVSDPAALQEYSKIVGPFLAASGGKALVRTAEVEPFEAGIKQRTVVIEFESFQHALAAYQSDEYKVALKALGSGAERDFRILEGVE